MASRKFDIIVLGATGYTGKFIVKELVERSISLDLNLAIAGRNLNKLEDVKDEVLKEFDSFKNLSLLKVDVTNFTELLEVTKLGKVIISAVGPYIIYGLKVVEACIASKTDYLDITGEPGFVDDSYVKFNQLATTSNVSIVHYCGFDSIPADLGVCLIRNKFKELQATPTQVEIFIRFDELNINYTTLQTIILSFSNLGKSRRAIRDMLPTAKPVGRKLPLSLLPSYENRVNLYTALFIGSDPSVIRFTQNVANHNGDVETFPLHISAYFGFRVFYNVLLAWFAILFSALFCRFNVSKDLLLNYPSWFTFGRINRLDTPPQRENLKKSGFQVHFIVKGVKNTELENLKKGIKPNLDVEVKAKFVGPDPGYIFTSKSVVAAALTLYQKKHVKDEAFPNGVISPAIAFKDTDLMDSLRKSSNEIKFEYL